MSTEDLFISNDDLLNKDPEKDYFSDLVGEDKKYKTQNDLAFSNLHKDAFIERLKQEKEEAVNEIKTRIKYEEFLDKLEQARKINDDDNQDDNDPVDTTTAMTPERIEKLLDERLTQRERNAAMQSNLNFVKARLLEALGPNYSQKLREQATALGVTPEYLNSMAAETPKALFRLLGIDGTTKKNTSMSPPKTQFNTDSFVPNTNKGKGRSYFDNIYNTNKELYFSAKTQNEMFQAIKDMGQEDFENS